jgi:ditrans,polycis-polyprenyl diphosphate synthase
MQHFNQINAFQYNLHIPKMGLLDLPILTIPQTLQSWGRRLVTSLMTTRPVPKHIAFIMDGNRRFADRRSLKTYDGHSLGYQRLIDALEWCLDLGVSCVSVYAFSIDNYQRSTDEVSALMSLAETKLLSIISERKVLKRHGVRVKIIGDLTLAPPSVQQAAAAAMQATAHHDRATLNICFSYTSSHEICCALDNNTYNNDDTVGNRKNNNNRSSRDALSDRLWTSGCPDIDLLIRTSGERRLSDFMLWQSRNALLVFTRVLWPEFGFLDLISALAEYQTHRPHLLLLQQQQQQGCLSVPMDNTTELFNIRTTDNNNRNEKNRRGQLESPRAVAKSPPASPSSNSSSSLGEDEPS